jgi:hypothetical protein
VIAFALMVTTVIIAAMMFGTTAAASTTLERLSNWASVYASYAQASPLELLFGLAIYQRDSIVIGESVIIDNAFIASFAAGGLFGLVFFLSVFLWMANELYGQAERNRAVLPYAVAFSTWAAGGVSGNFFVFPILVYILSSMCFSKPLRSTTASHPE